MIPISSSEKSALSELVREVNIYSGNENNASYPPDIKQQLLHCRQFGNNMSIHRHFHFYRFPEKLGELVQSKENALVWTPVLLSRRMH